jgi:hypothetical protein
VLERQTVTENSPGVKDNVLFAGLVWVAWWEKLMASMAAEEPGLAAALTAAAHGGGDAEETDRPVPWRAFLRSTPVRALAFTHFCNNWCAAARAWYGIPGRNGSRRARLSRLGFRSQWQSARAAFAFRV